MFAWGHIYKVLLGRVRYSVLGPGMNFIREHVVLNIGFASGRFERSKAFSFFEKFGGCFEEISASVHCEISDSVLYLLR